MLRPQPLPASIVQRLKSLVRAYLATADAGPRGKRGVPDLVDLDVRARTLLAEIAELERLEKDR